MKKTTLLLITATAAALFLSGCGGAGAPRPAATPEQAMMNLAESMQNNAPSGAWHMLPDSYQNDLNSVVSAYAAAMDADLWQAGTGVVRKLEEILRTKKELLLSSNLAVMGGGREALEQTYDTTAALLTSLKSSDLLDLQKLRNADLGNILATTGRTWMRELAKLGEQAPPVAGIQESISIRDTFANLKAERVSLDGDQAVLRITTPENGSEEVEFVRVEGKWIPEELASDWAEVIAGMCEGLQEITQMTPAEKSQALMVVGMVNGVLDQLLAAKTQQELEAVLGGVMGMMMGGGM